MTFMQQHLWVDRILRRRRIESGQGDEDSAAPQTQARPKKKMSLADLAAKF